MNQYSFGICSFISTRLQPYPSAITLKPLRLSAVVKKRRIPKEQQFYGQNKYMPNRSVGQLLPVFTFLLCEGRKMLQAITIAASKFLNKALRSA